MRYVMCILLLVIACQEQLIVPEISVPEQVDPVVLDVPVVPAPRLGVIATGNIVKRVSSARGTVTIERQTRSYKVTLENFRPTEVDEIQVVLTRKPMVVTSRDLDDFYIIGDLKGDATTQYYFIPSDVNVEEYKSITLVGTKNNVIHASAQLLFVEE